MLGVVGVGFARGVEIGIGEAIVDGVEAGGGGQAEHGHLDGGRLAGEDEHAVVGGVQGEVDEDIDAVGADRLGELGIGQAGGVEPEVGEGLELAGDLIGRAQVGIGVDRRRVRGRDGRRASRSMIPDGMGAEVGRNIADSQGAVGVAVVIVGSDLRGEGRGVAAAPSGDARPGGPGHRNRDAHAG